MQDSYFLNHEPCPRCGSRDNVGVYSDGHKFCFGCRKRWSAPDNLQNLKSKVENNNNKIHVADTLDTSSFSYVISAEAAEWLKKYGISDNEILHYGICWNSKTSSLVFPIFNNDTKELLYYQERYFGPPDENKPKYVTYGSKSQQLGFITNRNFPTSVVLVEDFVSAIKVSRYCTCSPLLGCSIDANGVNWLRETFSRVRVWLDMDKATQALREASKLNIKDTQIILTQFDPKDYTTQEIVKILSGYGLVKK